MSKKLEVQADANEVIGQLSSQIAVLSQEKAVLQSLVSQYQKQLQKAQNDEVETDE